VDLARSRANDILVMVLRRFDVLSLSVAEEKTDAVLFYGRTRPDFSPVIRVGRTYIKMMSCLKYLGLMLDSKLNFGRHFSYVSEKALIRERCRIRCVVWSSYLVGLLGAFVH